MLKIKDNISLEELEKYGFTLLPCGTSHSIFKEYPKTNDEMDISFSHSTRVLDIYISDVCLLNELSDILFNLIQAGLVEKVD